MPGGKNIFSPTALAALARLLLCRKQSVCQIEPGPQNFWTANSYALDQNVIACGRSIGKAFLYVNEQYDTQEMESIPNTFLKFLD